MLSNAGQLKALATYHVYTEPMLRNMSSERSPVVLLAFHGQWHDGWVVLILEYVLAAVFAGAVLFGLSLLVFGRGEELAPLPRHATPTQLPETPVTGDDVRAVRLRVRLRGYDMHEVDWVLEQLAAEMDTLRRKLAEHSLETASRNLDSDEAKNGS